MSLELLEIESGTNPEHTIIWLHGLGADGHDFEPIVPQLGLDIPIRFIFPHAPHRPVSINGGMVMRAWYDIDFNSPNAANEGISLSSNLISELVENEVQRGIPRAKIVLAGFSQGGVIAFEVALQDSQKFAGLIALSTYLHEPDALISRVSFQSVGTPIFMAHGEYDPMIPLSRAVASRDTLSNTNYQIEWHQYPIEHSVSNAEISDISMFLHRVLA